MRKNSLAAPQTAKAESYWTKWIHRTIRDENALLFLLGVRWLSLLPPALALALRSVPDIVASPLFSLELFAMALVNNLILTAFHPRLNRLLAREPLLLGVDMALAAVFIALTGGTNSPYELYALTPLLAAAFFFQIQGGLLAALAFTPLYLVALFEAHHRSRFSAQNLHEGLTVILSFFLVALVFGYPSVLLKRLHAATMQLQQTQEELAHIQTLAAVGKMAAHLSHEIRNPLSTIGGFARSLLRRPDDVERVRHNSQIIADETKRLEELLTDALDLARPRALSPGPCNVHEVLDRAWLLAGGATSSSSAGGVNAGGVGDAAHERGPVVIRKAYHPGLPLIEADATTLLRAFLNVLRNAVQVMPEGGTLTLSTRLDGAEVEIAIRDSGPGIAPDVLPTIFKPFITHRERGTGLGLAVTQEIIQQHGGRIEVQSELGKGTQFVFHLPLTPRAVQ